MKALLVGMHFRPPAKLVLEELPKGTALKLDPEPENPHDSQAVKVLWTVQAEALPSDEVLIGSGSSQSDLLDRGDLQLGYLAREGNKDLTRLKASGLTMSSASEVLSLMTGCPAHSASLLWGPNGEALVEVQEND